MSIRITLSCGYWVESNATRSRCNDWEPNGSQYCGVLYQTNFNIELDLLVQFWQCLTYDSECLYTRKIIGFLLQIITEPCWSLLHLLLWVVLLNLHKPKSTKKKCTSVSYLVRFRHLCGQLEHCVSYRFYKPLQTTPTECCSVFSSG